MGNPATPNFIPPGFTPADVTYHNVITEWHATNPAANTFEGTRRELLRVAHIVANLTHPFGARRVQPDGEARRARLRPALHERQRSGIQQRRRTEREQSRPDAAARHGHRRHSAHRSAQSVGVRRHEGARRLHDSADQQVRRGRRSEDARRDLRLRIPQRPPAVLGSHRRDDVRVGYRDEQHRGDQHRPRGRQLRLDEARGAFRERRDATRRRARPAVPAAGGGPGRAGRRTSSPTRSRCTTTTTGRR